MRVDLRLDFSQGSVQTAISISLSKADVAHDGVVLHAFMCSLMTWKLPVA